MTTNSPNPVDGDVQALIDVCKSDIARLEGTIRRCEANKIFSTIPGHKRDLLIRQIALAALTAEPVIYAIQDEEERKNGYMTEFSSSGIAGYVNPEKYGLTELPLYTIAPTQLLRPVELPDCVDDLHGIGPVMSADAVVEALRQQGYEVKND